MSGTHEASVVSIHAKAASTPAVHPMLAGLLPDLSVVRDWPARIAAVVGNATHPSVINTLSAAGFEPVVMSPGRAASLLPALGPISFFILGEDVFAQDRSVETVRAWHRCSPSARLKLVYGAEGRDPAIVVRSLRAGVTDVIDPDDHAAIEEALRQGLTQAGAARERVLAIGAHPDDVEIGCAGTLLDHRRRGDRVSILTLSRGAVGGDTASRLAEAAATADTIGAQLLMADLPDTAIDDGIATIRIIENVVQALNPTVVYVHSVNDNHQDHRAVSTATRAATRGVRRVLAYQSPSATNAFLPTQFVNVDETVRDKVQVLQMFGSQDGRSYLEPELVIASARYWARHLAANARYAEPFEVVRSMGELRHSATVPVTERKLTVVPETPDATPGHLLPTVLPADEEPPELQTATAT